MSMLKNNIKIYHNVTMWFGLGVGHLIMVFVEFGGCQAIGLSAKSEHNTGIMVLVTWFNNINPGYIPYSGAEPSGLLAWLSGKVFIFWNQLCTGTNQFQSFSYFGADVCQLISSQNQ